MSIILVILLSIFDSLPGVQIIQDSTMTVLLDEAVNGKREMVEIDGFRVQVYSSNKQQTAKETQRCHWPDGVCAVSAAVLESAFG